MMDEENGNGDSDPYPSQGAASISCPKAGLVWSFGYIIDETLLYNIIYGTKASLHVTYIFSRPPAQRRHFLTHSLSDIKIKMWELF